MDAGVEAGQRTVNAVDDAAARAPRVDMVTLVSPTGKTVEVRAENAKGFLESGFRRQTEDDLCPKTYVVSPSYDEAVEVRRCKIGPFVAEGWREVPPDTRVNIVEDKGGVMSGTMKQFMSLRTLGGYSLDPDDIRSQFPR